MITNGQQSKPDPSGKTSCIERYIILERGDLLKISAGVIVLVTVLVGCASSRTLTAVSSDEVEPAYPPIPQGVTGEDCAYNIPSILDFLDIPAGHRSTPSVGKAIYNAASKASGTYALADMTINRDRLITPVCSRVCVRVIGYPVAQTTGSRYLDEIRREFDWSD